METLAETNALLTMVDNHSYIRTLNNIFFWLDGLSSTPKSPTDWYWSKSGEKINFTIPWLVGQPNSSDQHCLTIGKETINQRFGFNDSFCFKSGYLRFICQRVELYIP